VPRQPDPDRFLGQSPQSPGALLPFAGAASSTMKRRRLITPLNLPLLSFGGLIAAGTILLMLPAAANGPPLRAIDALFIATSATCVTGLVVLDIGTRLTLFGQGVVLVLIQCGGLGLMTLSTVLMLFLGGRLSLVSRSVIQDSFTHAPDVRLPSLVLHVVLFTCMLETVGAGLLFVRFSQTYPFSRALYHALFHAVSAFCNAGFALYPENFLRFQADPLVNFTICGLIITGGLGFLVLLELKRLLLGVFKQPRPPRLSLHSKLALSVTAFLLASGTLAFVVLEWQGSMAGLPGPVKVMAAFFQSVTARTAGFNTLDLSNMANVTLIFTIVLMFVGASSGSTGGGIKTNTLGVLFALSRSVLRGEESPHIFRRTIAPGTVGRAISVLVAAALVVYVATMGLMWTEVGTAAHGLSRGSFLELLFETVSAFGTVGLSVGITSKLTSAGKLILVLVMYIGRVGPLSIAVALAGKERRRMYKYAEEHVMIG
jgi:trk system potassium uptake protein TrkH